MARLRITAEARATRVGSEAKFKKPRSLLVTVHDRAGAPLAGELVQCAAGGIGVDAPVAIGSDGSARIEGLYPQQWDVMLVRPGDRSFGREPAGRVDLTKPGDARVDLVLERERRCVLHLTVNGEKRLPATFDVWTVNERGMLMGGLGPFDEDPEEGIVRFPIRPAANQAKMDLRVSGRGCPPVAVSLPLPEDDSVLEGSAALVSGATVKIRVLPPSDGIHAAVLEAWKEASSTWESRNPRSDFDESGRKSPEITFDTLTPGRYRARDTYTGVVSESVEAVTGKSVEITLDLSRAGPVTIRVEGPAEGEASRDPLADRFAMRAATVSIEGAGLSRPKGSVRQMMMGAPSGGGIGVRINSEDTARVPGDRPVTFRVTHPLFSPAPDGGTATVTAPGSTVVLKLVKGPEAAFRAMGVEARPGSLGAYLRVFLFTGEARGEPAKTCIVGWTDGVARFGGYTPGRYTLWCDLATAAPLVLENVELGEGRTDLGELKFPDGATVRLKVLTREGQQPPSIDALAKTIDPPDYGRTGRSSRGTDDVLIRGLGPGRFKVEVRTAGLDSTPVNYDVVSTGSGEIPLTLDLR
jgi:hypothetical protein